MQANISANVADIALNAANIAKNAADIICPKNDYACPIFESGYTILNNKCIYLESLAMTHANAKLNCLAKMGCYGFGRLFEPKSQYMNNYVADEANQEFDDDWFYIGFNDIATDENYVFDSDNSPVLSAFSPKWYYLHGPGGNRSSEDCGILSAYTTNPFSAGQYL